MQRPTFIKTLDKNIWNKKANHPLQTWEWGEFRKAWGNEVVRLNFGQLTLHKIPFSNYKIGIFEKGPIPTQEMLDDLKKLAEEKKLLFVKLEPNTVPKDNKQAKKLINLLKRNGCVPGKTLFTPTTFWIDLRKNEEDLLKSFHPKTRYNIRLAQKYGVKIVEDNSENAFERYLELTRETVRRQGFFAHSEKYHRLMWEYLHRQMVKKKEKPIAHLLTALYSNEIIVTWILFVWKDFLYYPYGASSEKYKNVMANNLMMWEAIKFGKALGLKTFDLWGREPGKGFTRFKEGYSPEVVKFLGSWDLITSSLYWFYKPLEHLRWIILRLKNKILPPSF